MNRLALLLCGFTVSSVITFAAGGAAATKWRRLNPAICSNDWRDNRPGAPTIFEGKMRNDSDFQAVVQCALPEDHAFTRQEVKRISVYGKDSTNQGRFRAQACVYAFGGERLIGCGANIKTTDEFTGEFELSVDVSAWTASARGTATLGVAMMPGDEFYGVYISD